MKTKWAFIDLDGTLLNSKKKVSIDNLEVLKEYSKNGGNIVLTTGRWPVSSKKINNDIESFSNIQNKYLIALNGAYIYDLKQEKLIHSKSIDENVFNQILEIIKSYKVAAWIYSKKGIEEKKIFSVKIPIKKIIQKFNSGKIIELKENQIIDDVVYKFLLFSFHENEIDKIKKIFDEKFSDHLSIVRINKKTLEITANNTSKGEAVKFIQNIEKFDLSETVSLGDSQNDISMFKLCNIKIAFNAKDKALTSLSSVVYDNQKKFSEAFNKFVINYDSDQFKLNSTIYIDLLNWCKNISNFEIYKYENIHNYLIAQNKLIIRNILPTWFCWVIFEPLLISKKTFLEKEYDESFNETQIESIKKYIKQNKINLMIIEYKDNSSVLVSDQTKLLNSFNLNLSVFKEIKTLNHFDIDKEINNNVASISLDELNKLDYTIFKTVKTNDFYHIFSNQISNKKTNNDISKKFNIKEQKTLDNLLSDLDKFIKQTYESERER